MCLARWETKSPRSHLLAHRDHPQFSKEKSSESAGANEDLSCGFTAFRRIPPGVAPTLVVFVCLAPKARCLDGRNRARVIAESLARIIAAIRSTSVRSRSDRSYLPPKPQNLVLIDLAFVVLRFESRDCRSLVQYSFHMDLRNGLRELTAFAEH